LLLHIQTVRCHHLITGFGENCGYTEFAALVKLEDIGNGSAIVNTEFTRHVFVHFTHAVGYYGAMSDIDTKDLHNSWHTGSCKVMVATTAFGLGIGI